MHTTKAPWQRNRVGPYTLLRRLRHVTTSEEVGKVYTAWHRPSGRPALLVAPTAPAQLAPSCEYLLRVRSGTAPAPYVALEVEQLPEAGEPVAEVAQGVGTLWLSLRGVEQHPEALTHLAQPARVRSGQGVRVQAWAALGVVAVAVLLCLPRLWSAGEAPGAAPAQEAPTGVAEEALVEPELLPVDVAYPEHTFNALGLDMPPRPFKGQRKAPCEEGAEVEIQLKDGTRACWVGIKYSPKICKTRGYEYKGECYLPSMPTPRAPSSTLPLPPAPAQGAR